VVRKGDACLIGARSIDRQRPPDEVKRFKEKAVGHSPCCRRRGCRQRPDPLNFDSLFPVPEELVKRGYNEAAYQWERSNWGCKWGRPRNPILDEWEGGIVYEFDTGWVPPWSSIEHVSKEWSGLTSDLEYEECGIGFKGMAKAHGGQSDDHCVFM